MTLTPEQRDELRALAEKAAPGPWRVHAEAYEGMILAVGADEETVYATDADMALMGAARTAIPALLDALDAAEAAVQRVRGLHQPFEWSFGQGPVQSCRACADSGADEAHSEYPCPTARALDGEAGR